MVDYAKEYGIDIEELKKEHPCHPTQTQARRKHEFLAKEYWAWMRAINESEALGINDAIDNYKTGLSRTRSENSTDNVTSLSPFVQVPHRRVHADVARK
jgi:DNA-directed RNA polymerase specialized sigma subunit